MVNVKRIKDLMEEKKHEVKDLAKIINRSRLTTYLCLNGKKNFGLGELLKIAARYQVSIVELMV